MEVVIVIVCIIILLFISIIVSISHNRFKFSLIKIEEAESNIDMYLQKKLELFDKAIAIISKETKDEKFLNYLENTNDLNNFEINDLLCRAYNEFFKFVDDNEILFKNEEISKIIAEINKNETDLVASIKFYNDNVVDFNELISSFPSKIVAFFCRYKRKRFYNNEKRKIYEILSDD